jgi:hypothetical protein
MQFSQERLLTTHTGSLPRPADLVEIYAKRAAGETVDEGRLARLADAAMREVVRKQIACGIDVGNKWRAAAGEFLPLCSAPDDRLRRTLAPHAPRRRRTLPAIQGHACRADGGAADGRSQLAAEGDR